MLLLWDMGAKDETLKVEGIALGACSRGDYQPWEDVSLAESA